MPLVTVVTPTLNEQDFIGPCLDSLLAQDIGVEKVEILVVDGGSTDGTRQLVEEYQQVHPNVRLLDNPKQFTVYAFNIGILNASSELQSKYITFLNWNLRSFAFWTKSFQLSKDWGIISMGSDTIRDLCKTAIFSKVSIPAES